MHQRNPDFRLSQRSPRPLPPRGKDTFFARVYSLVRRIPRGRVLTYGQVAALLGEARWARTVGWALRACASRSVPCHRVLGGRGRCSPGYGSGHPERQRARLEAEGVRFRLDGTVDLAANGWLGPPRAGRRSCMNGSS